MQCDIYWNFKNDNYKYMVTESELGVAEKESNLVDNSLM